MKKRFTSLMTTLILSVFFSISASAYDVEVDGIYYSIDKQNKIAEVTYEKEEIASYFDNVVIPSTVEFEDVQYAVTRIGYKSFYGCSSLTSVTIPNSVTRINGWAFAGCSGLTSISIPNSVTTIENDVFRECSSLTSVTIPNSVTTIESGLFYNCKSLTSIIIPNSISKIGSYAFSGCTNLKSINIPDSLTSFEDGIFDRCSSLTSITIPNSITSIGHSAFNGCNSLTSITIPNSVSSIGNNAFQDCSSLTSFTIPNSVTLIDQYVFKNCMSLTSITIPNSITYIGEHSFEGCIGLTSVTIPNSVTRIGGWAFAGCSGLTSIEIPNSVTSIGNNAFYSCSSLTSVTISNSVTTIGAWVFSECNGIKNTIIVNDNFVYLPKDYIGQYSIPDNIKTIEYDAFKGCIGLTSIVIPNSVTKIRDSAFSFCSSLTSITIPNSVTYIGSSAFNYCSCLTSVTIPYSVTSIGLYAFENCNNLEKLNFDCSEDPHISSKIKELTIGDNSTIVYDYFKKMPLKKVYLGKKVKLIQSDAFDRSKLEELTITGEDTPYISSYVFATQDLSKATLYVPESKIDYYQTTMPWSLFGKILTLSGDTPSEPEKCAMPSILYVDGQLQFSCETEGAKCYYTLNNSDVKTSETLVENNSINLSACYDISCYAKAEGFINSDVATAKLYWLPSSGTHEGDNINNVAMRGIAIQSAGGFINISGLDNNEKVDFFGVDGKALGSAKSIDGSVSFSAKQGTVVVAKIGKESVKIAVE